MAKILKPNRKSNCSGLFQIEYFKSNRQIYSNRELNHNRDLPITEHRQSKTYIRKLDHSIMQQSVSGVTICLLVSGLTVDVISVHFMMDSWFNVLS